MPVAFENFVKHLTDSGVIAPCKLENFIPPKATPKDAQELARQLVQSKHLTKFQAQEIYQGRAKSLILGNYTILDKIGAGGMGQVFRAEHRRMHGIVAIKTLPRNMMKDAAYVARFERWPHDLNSAEISRSNRVGPATICRRSNSLHYFDHTPLRSTIVADSCRSPEFFDHGVGFE